MREVTTIFDSLVIFKTTKFTRLGRQTNLESRDARRKVSRGTPTRASAIRFG